LNEIILFKIDPNNTETPTSDADIRFRVKTETIGILILSAEYVNEAMNISTDSIAARITASTIEAKFTIASPCD